ncbi:hypothetical protein [Bradyrhizobium sp. NAS96.2]|uniref:hypothetical protein n=1 Tax=Bradyrhizobium sp. NAS96.2 TaxID=1680160 RepID=UPI00093A443B|nr:hypothetical protein [Bradyrhizobium sp. NAS96.2]OKO74443.1 hypothetical protein AC628_22500 [Bradyrhizobium sp. NAS96.2]
MTELTRRRASDPHRKGWNVFYGDVQVGWIDERAGVPTDADQWGWSCGFYPGCDSGQHTSGSAASFEEARGAFEVAWATLLPTRTEADFEAWRHQRDWTERKRAMWNRGEKLPSQQASSLMRCPCGETFDSHIPAESYQHRQHIYDTQKNDGIRR